MNWDELESERRHLTAADLDKISLLQQIKDSVGAIADRVGRLSEKVKQQAAHLPEWEIEVTEYKSSAGAHGASRVGWEPFAVWNANIYWRRQVK